MVVVMRSSDHIIRPDVVCGVDDVMVYLLCLMCFSFSAIKSSKKLVSLRIATGLCDAEW